MKIFYAMPFTGKTYEEIVEERSRILSTAKSFGLDIIEQFVGIEEKEKFESHAYGPLFIAEKDHNLIKASDLLIADFENHSIGRDCEIIMAKEILDKRVISIVSDSHMKNHPWVRLYSDYIVLNQNEAFKLASKLSQFTLSSQISQLSREEKDKIDLQITELLNNKNLSTILELLPTELKRRWQILFGYEYQTIIEYSFKELPKTLRVNTLKSDIQKFSEIVNNYSWKLTPLEISPTAFRLSTGTKIIFDDIPEHREGLFYVQELASMLPTIALDPKPTETILDIAAAPGSKTTHMSQLMENKGEILANDISAERLEKLKNIVERLGVRNVKYHLGDGTTLGDTYPESFDKVMIDGPCSNEGIIRYKAHKFFEWTLLQIYQLIKIQKNLLESGYKALKPGGVLVYSTCTYSPEENEAVIDYLLRKYPSIDVVPIKFNGIKTRNGLTKWEHSSFSERVTNTLRVYPQDNNSIGFFIAKIVKQY